MKITIKQIEKTEGHVGFEADLLNGKVKKAKMHVLEGARMFEAILTNRYFEDDPIIVQRICGICPVVHNLAAVKAFENTFNTKVPPGVILLRKLMHLGEIIESHSMHMYFLSYPDFLGIISGIDLYKKFTQDAQKALKVRAYGNELIRTIGGRSIHPLASCVGGFRRKPDIKILQRILKESKDILKLAENLGEIFAKISYPEYFRRTIFFSLSKPKEYTFYDGEIISSHKIKLSDKNFIKKITEEEKQKDVVKRVKFLDQVYFVGALARLNLQFEKLNPEAKKILKKARIKPPTYNTFHNLLAQAIETIHCIEESQKLLKLYLKNPPAKVFIDPKIKAGEGLGVIEAPRGTLYHYYKVDKEGIVKKANIITPTAQFLNNLEKDLKQYLAEMKVKSPRKRRDLIKQMVRVYDPCISCATH